MCGIAGIVLKEPALRHDFKRSLEAMLASQSHRGPDGTGIWVDDAQQPTLFLGHRRLAILDLTEASAQPMVSDCGNYVLTYNGELYNYREVRGDLEKKGWQFRTRGDTEVVLKALIEWGSDAFEQFNGMWAVAFFDRRNRRLLLCRDRFGEKPLYCYESPSAIYFSSEIKAICLGSNLKFAVNAVVAARFLGQSLLQAQEDTFFDGVASVPAGHFQIYSFVGGSPVLQAVERYWQYPVTTGDRSESATLFPQIRSVFADAVKIRLRSDVPVGVLLSGGLDSSSIAAVAHLADASNLKMLSVVSDDPNTSEEPYIDEMQRHLDVSVQKIVLSDQPSEGLAHLSRATWFNDEPVGGYSAVAHMLLMEKAKECGVTVLLSGQGADEQLCGYSKFLPFYIQQLFSEGRFGRAALAAAAMLRPPMTWLRNLQWSEIKRYTGSRSPDHSIFGERLKNLDWRVDVGLGGGSLQQRQAQDMERFSVPALTHYEDRMSMSASREIRLPFLDHRLVELLLPLEPNWKLHNGWTKWVFRNAMEPSLPSRVVWRRDKKGFSNPSAGWLRKEWKEAVTEIFGGQMLIHDLGLVDGAALLKTYRRYCSGKDARLGVKDIFGPLSLELWARNYSAYLR